MFLSNKTNKIDNLDVMNLKEISPEDLRDINGGWTKLDTVALVVTVLGPPVSSIFYFGVLVGQLTAN